jgi:hypothetical protein
MYFSHFAAPVQSPRERQNPAQNRSNSLIIKKNIMSEQRWHGACVMEVKQQNQASTQEKIMTAARKIEVDSDFLVDLSFNLPPATRLRVAPAPAAVVTASVEAAPAAASTVKNMALFLSAPFVGLAYALLLPFIGIGMLAWTVAKAVATADRMAATLRIGKAIAKMIAAPFAGLAFVALLPFIGAAILVKVARE